MKKLVLLLIVVVLYLVLQPAVTLFSPKIAYENTCCNNTCNASNNDENNAENTEKDCEGKICNPFNVCISCVLICYQLESVFKPKSVSLNAISFFYKANYFSYFSYDFWQPPKEFNNC